MLRYSTPRRRSLHAGFTLIELMMVVVIIGVLVSLLTAAVASAMRNGRIAEQRADISSLEGALADYRGVFGKYPPSQVTIYEAATAWDAKSRALIRANWPLFDFTNHNDPPTNTATSPTNPIAGNRAMDINGDGDETDVFVLTGAECLTFFLGGLLDSSGQAMIGFSKNPSNPFDRAGTNRLGPFYAGFTPDRISDVDGDGVPELLDKSQGNPAPIIYASSNDGSGYNRTTISGTPMCPDLFVYTNDLTAPTNTDMKQVYMPPGATRALNPQSFQLISAGEDGLYGVGGAWSDGSNLTGPREAEQDNITNLSPSTMGG